MPQASATGIHCGLFVVDAYIFYVQTMQGQEVAPQRCVSLVEETILLKPPETLYEALYERL